MLLTLLAFYERASVFVKNAWEDAKSATRDWLGPQPQNLYLLADGAIIPSAMSIPVSILNTAFLYHISSNQITPAGNHTEGRFRRLPFIAMRFDHPLVGNTDISDWLGEIRANPVPDLHAKQLISLWSHVHNIYVPLNGGLHVHITKSDGTDIEITYD